MLNLTQPRIPDIVSHAGRATEASKKSQCNNILLTSANKGHKQDQMQTSISLLHQKHDCQGGRGLVKLAAMAMS